MKERIKIRPLHELAEIQSKQENAVKELNAARTALRKED